MSRPNTPAQDAALLYLRQLAAIDALIERARKGELTCQQALIDIWKLRNNA